MQTGLFKYQLKFTVELLKLHYGNGQIKILEECLFQIPSYLNLKILKKGFEIRLTVAEYRDLMKIMIFALDELIPEKKLNKNLYDLFSLWIDIIDKFQSQLNNVSCHGIISKKATMQITLHTIDQFIDQLDASNLDNLWMHGIEQLEHCIYDYLRNVENWTLQNIENETVFIETFDFAYLNNDYKVVIHASSNYYGQGAFSNVCVEMDKSEENDYLTDDGLCYAKVYKFIN
ncbi:hypothetical protein C2G38_2180083 [Gigaspora rosea]|uniref:Uncharacterized protein n=1 Tax=Gigaspora rosea TaxID=44941 RepID=A0A397VCC4_9GLOM|nr:hypothetical protein C2G38_2180083 [Gigaspora rosea]